MLSPNYDVHFSGLKSEEKVDGKTVLALIRGRQGRGLQKIMFSENFHIFRFETGKMYIPEYIA